MDKSQIPNPNVVRVPGYHRVEGIGGRRETAPLSALPPETPNANDSQHLAAHSYYHLGHAGLFAAQQDGSLAGHGARHLPRRLIIQQPVSSRALCERS
jgi:hypothetical protein